MVIENVITNPRKFKIVKDSKIIKESLLYYDSSLNKSFIRFDDGTELEDRLVDYKLYDNEWNEFIDGEEVIYGEYLNKNNYNKTKENNNIIKDDIIIKSTLLDNKVNKIKKIIESKGVEDTITLEINIKTLKDEDVTFISILMDLEEDEIIDINKKVMYDIVIDKLREDIDVFIDSKLIKD